MADFVDTSGITINGTPIDQIDPAMFTDPSVGASFGYDPTLGVDTTGLPSFYSDPSVYTDIYGQFTPAVTDQLAGLGLDPTTLSASYAPDTSGITVDPYSGAIFDAQGNPIAGASAQDIAASVKDMNTALASGDPNVISRAFTALNNFLKPINAATGGNLGRTLAVLGLGGLGMALGSAVAGSGGTFKLPSPIYPTPTAGQTVLDQTLTANSTPAQNLGGVIGTTLQGQKTIADLLASQAAQAQTANAIEAPQQALIRAQALKNISAMIGAPVGSTPGTTTPGALPSDPTTQAILARVDAVLNGTAGADPIVEKAITDAKQQLQDQFAARGPQYAESSPGIEKARANALNADMLRYNDMMRSITDLLPQANARQTTLGNLQTQAANTNTGLSALGLPNTQTISNLFNQTLPTAPLAGVGVNNTVGTSQAQNALNNQAAIGSFLAQQQANQGLSNSIANLFARAAGAGFNLGGGTTG